MDTSRVVDVWAADPSQPGSFGSGYLVASDLVLTAKHILCRDGGDQPLEHVAIRFLNDPAPIPCTVIWPQDGRLDVALLRLPAEARRPGAPPRWGRLVTTGTGIPWQAIGFPYAMRGRDGLRDTDHADGVINSGGGVLGRRINADVRSAVPERGQWVGMSGAALFCGPLLTGVIIEDPPPYGSRRLVAEPIDRVLADPAMAKALGVSDRFPADPAVAPALGGPVPEPVGLHDLFRPPIQDVRAGTPGSLLSADRQIIAFHGRDALLQELSRWRDGTEPLSVRLITGEGGQGKTRLARRLIDLTPTDWVSGFLNLPHHDDAEPYLSADLAEGLRTSDRPVLIVADYAESGPQRIARLLDALLEHPPPRPVRLLLLARTTGAWWHNLHQRLADEHPRSVTAPIPLTPLANSPDERLREFTSAAERFAELLPGFPELPDADWAHLARQVTGNRPDLSAERYGNALTVHMAALNALLRAAIGDDPATVTDPEAELVGHERTYLRRVARRRQLLRPGVLSSRLDPDEQRVEAECALWRALAAAILLGPCTTDRATAVGRLASDTYATDVEAWLAALYPPAEHERATGIQIAAIQPDRLAERLVGQILTEQDDLLAAVAALTDDINDANTLLTIAARAAARPAFTTKVDSQIQHVITHLNPYAAAAQLTALAVERTEPLIAGLLHLGRQSPEQLTTQFDLISDPLPQSSLTLAGLAADVTGLQTRMCRELATADPGKWNPSLAVSLSNHAVRLAEVGRRVEAVSISEEAVELRRGLAEASPDAYLPDLARSLNNHANLLAGVGRRVKAVQISEEAVALYRGLAEANPDAYLPDLARSLNNHANWLAGVGRRVEAVQIGRASCRERVLVTV